MSTTIESLPLELLFMIAESDTWIKEANGGREIKTSLKSLASCSRIFRIVCAPTMGIETIHLRDDKSVEAFATASGMTHPWSILPSLKQVVCDVPLTREQVDSVASSVLCFQKKHEGATRSPLIQYWECGDVMKDQQSGAKNSEDRHNIGITYDLSQHTLAVQMMEACLGLSHSKSPHTLGVWGISSYRAHSLFHTLIRAREGDKSQTETITEGTRPVWEIEHSIRFCEADTFLTDLYDSDSHTGESDEGLADITKDLKDLLSGGNLADDFYFKITVNASTGVVGGLSTEEAAKISKLRQTFQNTLTNIQKQKGSRLWFKMDD